MSAKALLISIAAVVLSLGVIGAAFATGMDFFNVGALSSGTEAITQVDTDYVGYTPCESSMVDSLKVCKVIASFTKHLGAGSQIYAGVTADGDYIAKGKVILTQKLVKQHEIEIPMNQLQESFDPKSKALAVTVTVAER